ncbi:hypothetical protein CVT24_005197 [Panaeolus cyanescens]|uniref:Uncharacterized protein n=1 Tax=Panaeolus cyanescens TaxID=181874 RepID=A0A409Y9G4_9AGAR|nr:hypothetical protein CVT24_005197 [Panaeolus cyanescens]
MSHNLTSSQIFDLPLSTHLQVVPAENQKKNKKDKMMANADAVFKASGPLLHALRDVAMVAPVPFLRQAAGLAVTLWTTVDSMRDNQAHFERLRDTAVRLIVGLNHSFTDSQNANRWMDEQVSRILKDIVLDLQQITSFCEDVNRRPIYKRALYNMSDKSKVREYEDKFRNTVMQFQTLSHVKLHESLSVIYDRSSQIMSEQRKGVANIIQNDNDNTNLLYREIKVTQGMVQSLVNSTAQMNMNPGPSNVNPGYGGYSNTSANGQVDMGVMNAGPGGFNLRIDSSNANNGDTFISNVGNSYGPYFHPPSPTISMPSMPSTDMLVNDHLRLPTPSYPGRPPSPSPSIGSIGEDKLRRSSSKSLKMPVPMPFSKTSKSSSKSSGAKLNRKSSKRHETESEEESESDLTPSESEDEESEDEEEARRRRRRQREKEKAREREREREKEKGKERSRRRRSPSRSPSPARRGSSRRPSASPRPGRSPSPIPSVFTTFIPDGPVYQGPPPPAGFDPSKMPAGSVVQVSSGSGGIYLNNIGNSYGGDHTTYISVKDSTGPVRIDRMSFLDELFGAGDAGRKRDRSRSTSRR